MAEKKLAAIKIFDIPENHTRDEERHIEEFTMDQVDEMGLCLSGASAITDVLSSVNDTDGLREGTICSLMFIMAEKLDRIATILHRRDLKEEKES